MARGGPRLNTQAAAAAEIGHEAAAAREIDILALRGLGLRTDPDRATALLRALLILTDLETSR